MEGLLRPIGPEEERTYWIRRGLLVLVVVLLLIGLGFWISSVGRADETRVEAEPATTPAAVPAPAAAPTTESTGAAPAAVVKDEAVPVPSSARTEEPATVPATGGQPAPQSQEPLPPEPANTFHSTPPQPGAATTQAQPAAVQPCAPAALRLGVETTAVKTGTPAILRLSATNGGAQNCILSIDKNNFALTVAAGDQQVWSANDCVAGAPVRSATLAPGMSMNWTVEWRGEKSSPQCQGNPQQVGPGDYVVKAEIRGAAAATTKLALHA